LLRSANWLKKKAEMKYKKIKTHVGKNPMRNTGRNRHYYQPEDTIISQVQHYSKSILILDLSTHSQ